MKKAILKAGEDRLEDDDGKSRDEKLERIEALKESIWEKEMEL